MVRVYEGAYLHHRHRDAREHGPEIVLLGEENAAQATWGLHHATEGAAWEQQCRAGLGTKWIESAASGILLVQ